VPADDVSSIAANGSVVAKLVDAAGNASTAKIQDFTVDTLAPVLDSATVNDENFANSVDDSSWGFGVNG
jgi:hypothetical protein